MRERSPTCRPKVGLEASFGPMSSVLGKVWLACTVPYGEDCMQKAQLGAVWCNMT